MTTASSVCRPVQLAFIVAEDWFFVSHFLPMLRAARALGLGVVVICRVSRHAEIIEGLGGRVVALNVERRQFGPLSISSQILKVARILRRERIDIVHCIALRSVVVGGFAAICCGIKGRIFAVTGGGFLAVTPSRRAVAAKLALRWLFRLFCIRAEEHFLFENVADPEVFGLHPDQPQVTILRGAGVDPSFYTMQKFPTSCSLKLAMVCRMVWSKGPDIAVKAVSLARERGYDVGLSLFGAPDPSNPRSVPTDTLTAWSGMPGIKWHGASSDVRSIWAEHHLSIMPTRGGEGLPRSILEAAACGRPILTTNVPGCRDFVRHGRDGWLVQVDDAAALSERICVLAENKAAVVAAGESARQRVLDGYTETHVVEQVQEVYRQITQALDQRRP